MSEQAKLPIELYKNTIENMDLGQKGYTVPWAMHVDYDGNLWLNAKYNIAEQPRGTVSMLVKRSAHGYEVEMGSYCGERYSWSPGAEYVGGSNSVPVVSFQELEERSE